MSVSPASLRRVSQLSLRLYQLARTLDQRFVPNVPKDGIKEGPTAAAKDEAEKQRRSRALTALAAVMLAGIPDEEAAERVTDRWNDDGIDGFAVPGCQASQPVIYLVQAKWSAKGNYNLGNNDVRTLVDGFRKLRTWDDLDSQNPSRAFKTEIWPTVITPEVKFVLAWVTSGENKPLPPRQERGRSAGREGCRWQGDCRNAVLGPGGLHQGTAASRHSRGGRGDGRVHPQPGNGRPDTVAAGGRQR